MQTIGNILISLYKLELRLWVGLSVQLCLAGKPRGVVCELVSLPFPPFRPHVAFVGCPIPREVPTSKQNLNMYGKHL